MCLSFFYGGCSEVCIWFPILKGLLSNGWGMCFILQVKVSHRGKPRQGLKTRVCNRNHGRILFTGFIPGPYLARLFFNFYFWDFNIIAIFLLPFLLTATACINVYEYLIHILYIFRCVFLQPRPTWLWIFTLDFASSLPSIILWIIHHQKQNIHGRFKIYELIYIYFIQISYF